MVLFVKVPAAKRQIGKGRPSHINAHTICHDLLVAPKLPVCLSKIWNIEVLIFQTIRKLERRLDAIQDIVAVRTLNLKEKRIGRTEIECGAYQIFSE